MDDWMNVIAKRDLSEEEIIKFTRRRKAKKAAKKEAKQRYGKNAPQTQGQQQSAPAAPNLAGVSPELSQQTLAAVNQAANPYGAPMPQNTGRRITMPLTNVSNEGTNKTGVPLPQQQQQVPLPNRGPTAQDTQRMQQQQQQKKQQGSKMVFDKVAQLRNSGNREFQAGNFENAAQMYALAVKNLMEAKRQNMI